MRTRPYGERALLCEVDDPADVPGLRLAALDLDGVTEVVAGACTLLVVGDVAPQRLADLVPVAVDPRDAAEVELDVIYDGADLDDVADLTGLSVEDVIAAHTGATYSVRFCGFAPGFAYLDGLDPRLHIARRAEPRTSVPAGSVAIADEFAGVYPRATPGGWRLLGRTDAPLWDEHREALVLLSPGTRVRFRPT